MQPNRLGRVLGVGARVAAKTLKERAEKAAAQPPKATQAAASLPATLPIPAAAPSQAAAGPQRASGMPSGAAAGSARSAKTRRAPAANYAEGGRRLARGAGRFGASLWRPFAHATGVLTLEISGVFFALFTLFFAIHASQIFRRQGWHDLHFIVYAVFGALFAWFAVSSFWRARRKSRGM